MSDESFTLYKLMILYMLDNLDFPMTTSQLSEFFVNYGYTSYFHLQQVINELADAEFIRGELVRNTTNFHLTEYGKETIDMFNGKIPEAKTTKMFRITNLVPANPRDFSFIRRGAPPELQNNGSKIIT